MSSDRASAIPAGDVGWRSASAIRIRDPFVWVRPEEMSPSRAARYTLYGTTDPDPWNGPGIGFDAWISDDLRQWQGPFPVFRPRPGIFWGTTQFWAPEVYWMGGDARVDSPPYVMLATFKAEGVRRAVQVLRAESPLGPFEPDGVPLTPSDWECLDGTLYRDRTGRLWMVFCQEWLQIGDGRITAMELSPDLRARRSPPHTLWRASEAPWVRPVPSWIPGHPGGTCYLTDGPFVHRDRGGCLHVLWSSFGPGGYALGVATSESGSLLGPYRQHTQPLIVDDGGHGMVFAADGALVLAHHVPNLTPNERPVFLSVADDLGQTKGPFPT